MLSGSDQIRGFLRDYQITAAEGVAAFTSIGERALHDKLKRYGMT